MNQEVAFNLDLLYERGPHEDEVYLHGRPGGTARLLGDRVAYLGEGGRLIHAYLSLSPGKINSYVHAYGVIFDFDGDGFTEYAAFLGSGKCELWKYIVKDDQSVRFQRFDMI